MLICDCNGWNDAPEDEREALDAYEGVIQAQLYQPEYPAAPNGQMLELAPDSTSGRSIETAALREPDAPQPAGNFTVVRVLTPV